MRGGRDGRLTLAGYKEGRREKRLWRETSLALLHRARNREKVEGGLTSALAHAAHTIQSPQIYYVVFTSYSTCSAIWEVYHHEQAFYVQFWALFLSVLFSKVPTFTLPKVESYFGLLLKDHTYLKANLGRS